MKRRVVILLVAICCCIRAAADGGVVQKMAVERLPDLNIPRSGHAIAAPGGEITVIGGHTTGFLLTTTAEYYKDGRWHTVETLYPHDFGACATASDGSVIVAGGCAEAFGVGRNFGAERYEPSTHTFSSVPILDQRRARFTIARLSSGQYAVSGNWGGQDGIGIYSPELDSWVQSPVSQGRANPYILQTGPDEAFIFNGVGNQDERWDLLAVDRLKGEPFEEPLFRKWTPFCEESGYDMQYFFIGDEAVGGYAWLFPATRKEDGQTGILKLVGETFSLLETEIPIPMAAPDGEPIGWGAFQVDRGKENGYLISGFLPSGRVFVCRICYSEALRGGKAPITLYSAEVCEPSDQPLEVAPILLPGGRIAFAGGYRNDNYHPLADAFILHTEPLIRKTAVPGWLWVIAALLAAACIFLIVRYLKHKNEPEQAATPSTPETETPASGTDLMSRICKLLEQEQVFRRKDLTKAVLAEMLGTNVTYVTATINSQTGQSFTDLVTGYRIRYAQELMRKHPEMRLMEVAEEAGFASEKSFFRTFKTQLGMTPGEWKQTEN